MVTSFTTELRLERKIKRKEKELNRIQRKMDTIDYSLVRTDSDVYDYYATMDWEHLNNKRGRIYKSMQRLEMWLWDL